MIDGIKAARAARSNTSREYNVNSGRIIVAEQAYEVNFDGIVGPTHNYSGLSYGNIPSTDNKNLESNPREAALQGLGK